MDPKDFFLEMFLYLNVLGFCWIQSRERKMFSLCLYAINYSRAASLILLLTLLTHLKWERIVKEGGKLTA